MIEFYLTTAPYGFFSNFAPYPITMEGKVYATVEHYFQAQKYAGTFYGEQIRFAASPKDAAHMGRSREHSLRSDWEEVKERVMLDALFAKFTQHQSLKWLLLNTGEELLVEYSPSDWYWGSGADRKGANRLGMLLMEVRKQLREEEGGGQS